MRKIKGIHEEQKRSMLKTLSWRVVSTSSTMLAVYILTGHLDLTVGVGLLDIFLRTPLYFFHERAWDRVSFGRTLSGKVKLATRIPAVTAQPSEDVSSVIHKMISSEIGAVIVVDSEDKPIGLITEKDILKRILNVGKEPSLTRMKEIASSPVAKVEYDAQLTEALKMMHNKQIRRLAVTQKGKVIGIITERRILEALI